MIRLATFMGNGLQHLQQCVSFNKENHVGVEPQLSVGQGDQWPHSTQQTELHLLACLLYTSPSPRDATLSRMPSSA